MPDDVPSGQDPRGPYVVDPAPALDARRSGLSLAAFGVIVVVVGALTTWGLLTPPPPSPPQVFPTARPSTAPASGPPAPGVADGTGPAHDDDAVLAQLARRADWGDCPVWRGFGGSPGVGPALVASARVAQGIENGRLEVDDLQGGTVAVWLGVDARAAVEELGGTVTVRAGPIVWTAVAPGSGPPVAIRLDATTLDDGTAYWQERVRAMPAPYCVGEVAAGPPARVVEVDRGADALGRLFVEMGIDVCRTWQRMETAGDTTPAEIDRAATVVPVGGSGWTAVPLVPGYGARQTRVWVGSDPAEAAAQHGSELLVLQAGDPSADDPAAHAWMAVLLDGRPAAVQFRIVETPAGRSAWLPTPNAAGIVGACSYQAVRPGEGSDGGAEGPEEGAELPGPTVELLRGGTSALAMLTEHFGWTGCRMLAAGGIAEPPPAALIERLGRSIDASGTRGGWHDLATEVAVDPGRAWVGDDLVTLARAANVAVVALDGSATAWLADMSRARAWRVVTTPEGRTAWFATGAVLAPDAPCTGDIEVPAGVDGIRSFTCWTDRDRCIEAVRTAIRAAPDAFTPGTEVAAGIGEWCESGRRCPWAGPNMPVVVTAAAHGWTSSADVRVFSAGWRRVSTPFREIPPDESGAGVLAMASRPSLPLPVAPTGDPGSVYCPASGITGELRGSPWDPRVAWVGLSTVQWPEGFVARFTPSLELVSPTGTVYRLGDAIQASGLVGDEPVFEACRIAGTSTP